MRPLIPAALALLILAVAACERDRPAGAAGATDAEMVVYKSPACGCCDLWIDHVRESGYSVAAVDLERYDEQVEKKREHGVPMDLGSCHTARIAGYTVEGHVPAHVIDRLLAERPEIRGIAVPGMPIGSPGMEGPNPRPYQVIALGHDGSRSVYETVDPRQPPPSSDAR